MDMHACPCSHMTLRRPRPLLPVSPVFPFPSRRPAHLHMAPCRRKALGPQCLDQPVARGVGLQQAGHGVQRGVAGGQARVRLLHQHIQKPLKRRLLRLRPWPGPGRPPGARERAGGGAGREEGAVRHGGLGRVGEGGRGRGCRGGERGQAVDGRVLACRGGVEGSSRTASVPSSRPCIWYAGGGCIGTGCAIRWRGRRCCCCSLLVAQSQPRARCCRGCSSCNSCRSSGL